MVKKVASKPPARPSSQKTRPAQKEKGPDQPDQPAPQDVAYQQKTLNVFRNTFTPVLTSVDFTTVLQEVKQALFNRDFDKAFGNEAYLEVYAARWSPTRTLCYASVLDGLQAYLRDIHGTKAVKKDIPDAENSYESVETAASLRVLSLGGAAAELVALGVLLGGSDDLYGEITLLDSAPWGGVVSKLASGLTTPPPLSKYASEAARASNAAMVAPPARLQATFVQGDILALGKESLTRTLGSSPLLVTLLFTLNELFTSGGIGKTTTFLLALTAAIAPGSLLLVVDSPGSYSEATVGKESKRYPMQWLLDKILLGTDSWMKVESHDSLWFRLPEGLDYLIPLENMRYQMHLYRAKKTAD